MSKNLQVFLEWELVRREYTVDKSRFDFLLALGDRRLLLEVKSVTLSRNNKGYFPDAVTKRGARHVQELTQIVLDERYEAAVLFVAQREDIESIQ
ncbi:DNA/RNA nuclease SfsA, partial [Bacillus sp. JCM 19041]|uniref:DNA/RNA nuclease SfsA n=1 Tax=Bacillus sp. JCM 19041 TaxID=1460637 RepID=UPI000A710456